MEPRFPHVQVQIPDDAEPGLIRSRVQKALASAGLDSQAKEYIEDTNHFRDDAKSLLRTTSHWVRLLGTEVEAFLSRETPTTETPNVERDSTPPRPAAWQYKVVKNLTAARLEETLNGLGAQGWELVSMTGLDGVFTVTGNKLYAVMKRQGIQDGHRWR